MNVINLDILGLVASRVTRSDVPAFRLVSTETRAAMDVTLTCLETAALDVGLARRFPNVTCVSLQDQHCCFESQVRALKECKKLGRLCIYPSRRSMDSNSLLQVIASELTQLTALDFKGPCQLSWHGLEALSSLTGLQDLSASMQLQSIPASPGITHLLSRLTHLAVGETSKISYLDDDALGTIGWHAGSLRALDCSGCIDISDAGVEAGLSGPMGRSLQTLSLHSCVRITSRLGHVVASQAKSLASLNLRGCMQFNDDGLAALLTVMSLRELSLQGSQIQLGRAFPTVYSSQLATLNLSHCELLVSLEPLAALKGSLASLDVSHCPMLPVTALPGLAPLTHLTELRASGMRCLAAPTDMDAFNAELEAALACLTELHVLDLSEFRHHLGLPLGLLKGIARMPSLRHLNLAGCCRMAGSPIPPQPPAYMLATEAEAGEATSPEKPAPGANHQCGVLRRFEAEACAGVMAAHQMSTAQQVAAAQGGALSYLASLSHLCTLDISDWQHAHPGHLVHLSSLTSLQRLCMSRFGNDWAAAATSPEPNPQGSSSFQPSHLPTAQPGKSAGGVPCNVLPLSHLSPVRTRVPPKSPKGRPPLQRSAGQNLDSRLCAAEVNTTPSPPSACSGQSSSNASSSTAGGQHHHQKQQSQHHHQQSQHHHHHHHHHHQHQQSQLQHQQHWPGLQAGPLLHFMDASFAATNSVLWDLCKTRQQTQPTSAHLQLGGATTAAAAAPRAATGFWGITQHISWPWGQASPIGTHAAVNAWDPVPSSGSCQSTEEDGFEQWLQHLQPCISHHQQHTQQPLQHDPQHLQLCTSNHQQHMQEPLQHDPQHLQPCISHHQQHTQQPLQHDPQHLQPCTSNHQQHMQEPLQHDPQHLQPCTSNHQQHTQEPLQHDLQHLQPCISHCQQHTQEPHQHGLHHTALISDGQHCCPRLAEQHHQQQPELQQMQPNRHSAELSFTAVLTQEAVRPATNRGACSPHSSSSSMSLPSYDLQHPATPPGKHLRTQMQQQQQQQAAPPCPNLDDSLQTGLHGLLRLRELTMEGCALLTDAGLAACHTLPALEALQLGGCRHITGIHLASAAQSCSGLRVLGLGHCHSLQDDHFASAVPYLRTLGNLNLAGCGKVGDKTCLALAFSTHLGQLTDLSVRSCQRITSRGMTALLQGLPSLKHLNLASCGGLDDSAAAVLLQRHCPSACAMPTASKGALDSADGAAQSPQERPEVKVYVRRQHGSLTKDVSNKCLDSLSAGTAVEQSSFAVQQQEGCSAEGSNSGGCGLHAHCGECWCELEGGSNSGGTRWSMTEDMCSTGSDSDATSSGMCSDDDVGEANGKQSLGSAAPERRLGRQWGGREGAGVSEGTPLCAFLGRNGNAGGTAIGQQQQESPGIAGVIPSDSSQWHPTHHTTEGAQAWAHMQSLKRLDISHCWRLSPAVAMQVVARRQSISVTHSFRLTKREVGDEAAEEEGEEWLDDSLSDFA